MNLKETMAILDVLGFDYSVQHEAETPNYATIVIKTSKTFPLGDRNETSK